MTTPAKPLRLQVIDRIITVLEALTEGSEYWKAPGMVARRYVGPDGVVAYPVYSVFPGDGQAPEQDSGEYRETFTVIVCGVVRSSVDIVTEMEHALADIRRAVDKDARLGTAGSLGALTVSVELDVSSTDKGENLALGLGFLEQHFRVQIAADPFGA